MTDNAKKTWATFLQVVGILLMVATGTCTMYVGAANHFESNIFLIGLVVAAAPFLFGVGLFLTGQRKLAALKQKESGENGPR
jgi:hypothetical protein